MKNAFAKAYLKSKLRKLQKAIFIFKHSTSYKVIVGLLIGIISYQQPVLIIISLILIALTSKHSKFLVISLIIGLTYSGIWFHFVATESLTENNKIVTLQGLVIDQDSSNIVIKSDYIGLITIQSKAANYGDYIEIKGTLSVLNKDNAGSEAYFNYLKSQGILYSINKPKVIVIGSNIFLHSAYLIRSSIIQTNSKYLNSIEAGFVNALMFNDKSFLDKETKDNLTFSGLVFIITSTGIHFYILSSITLFFAGLFNRRYLLLISILAIFFLFLIIGIQNISAFRVMLMLLISIFSKVLGRPSSKWLRMMQSFVILLLICPLYYSNLSLIISIFAQISIYAFNTHYNYIISHLRYLPTIIKRNVSLNLSLNTLMPLLFEYLFNKSSIAPLLLSIFITPVIPFIILTDLIIAFISRINLNSLNKILFKLISYPIDYLISLPKAVSDSGIGQVGNTTLIILITFILLLIILVFDYRRFIRKNLGLRS